MLAADGKMGGGGGGGVCFLVLVMVGFPGQQTGRRHREDADGTLPVTLPL